MSEVIPEDEDRDGYGAIGGAIEKQGHEQDGEQDEDGDDEE